MHVGHISEAGADGKVQVCISAARVQSQLAQGEAAWVRGLRDCKRSPCLKLSLPVHLSHHLLHYH